MCLYKLPLRRALTTVQSRKFCVTSPTKMPPVIKTFQRVCLGGTFDNIHSGHERLLKEAVSRCTECLTIGVTDESMVRSKLLWELITPVDERIANITKFVKSVNQAIEYKVVPINDPFGPATADETLQCIVVSEETIRGAIKINDIRKERHMSELEVVVVNLIAEEGKESDHEEDKISSSTNRIRKLGTLLKEPLPKPNLPDKPYVIGLTGGIASGKSNIAKELGRLGAGLVDCDKIAHKTYEKGSSILSDIVNEFGDDIIGDDGNVDRRKLGAIVFGNKEKLKKLESLVWPETSNLVDKEIERLSKDHQVIIVEAAILLEAGWNEKVHQVWVSIIPEAEAIARLKTRNNLNEEEAKKRITSQISNSDRVRQANVVFCSLWEFDFTKKQVEKAWNMLNEKFLK
ncbi:Bifunctional coenzyme A synthase [Halotydeus destructor]|nr:Bifunctional coenzyme A synthase [Halotydeus destructor]